MLVDAMERDDEIQRQMGLPNPMVPMRLKPVGRAGSEPGGIRTWGQRDPNAPCSDRRYDPARPRVGPVGSQVRSRPLVVRIPPDAAGSFLQVATLGEIASVLEAQEAREEAPSGPQWRGEGLLMFPGAVWWKGGG